jgi:hypothetical protein
MRSLREHLLYIAIYTLVTYADHLYILLITLDALIDEAEPVYASRFADLNTVALLSENYVYTLKPASSRHVHIQQLVYLQ